MDYEKKHKEEVARATQLWECGDITRENLEYIFPELAESEDERIRGAIIDHLKDNNLTEWAAWLEKQGEPMEINPTEFDTRLQTLIGKFDNLPKEELIGSLSFWLNVVQNDGTYKDEEKQGKQKVSYTTIVKTGDGGINALVTRCIEMPFGAKDSELQEATYFIPKGYYAKVEGDKAVIKKGEQTPVNKVVQKFKVGDSIKTTNEEPLTITKIDDKGYWSEDLLICGFDDAAKWELVEQKPADKVEPKFKVGDWVFIEEIEGYKQGPFQIKYLSKQGYCFDKDRVIPFCTEDLMSFWTIQDAKDGDVLCCESGWTCIFKTLNSDNISFSSYCFMDNTGWFCETGSESHTLEKAFIKAYNGNIYPATKEQHDLLFQKMNEAGYEWDAEKKELRKNKQEPIWEWDAEKKELKKIDVRENLSLDGDLMEADCMIVEQKPALSEEDKDAINHLLAICNGAKKFIQFESCSREDIEKCQDWLKSIKFIG